MRKFSVATIFISGEYLHCESAHANTRHSTEKQAFRGLDAQTAVKRCDGEGSTCQVMDHKDWRIRALGPCGAVCV